MVPHSSLSSQIHHLLLLALGGGVKSVIVNRLILEAVGTDNLRVTGRRGLTLVASPLADVLTLDSALLPAELRGATVDASRGGVRNVAHYY